MNVRSLFINGRRKTMGVNRLSTPMLSSCLGCIILQWRSLSRRLILLVKARKQFEDLNDPDGKANCSLLIAATYRTFGNFDLALKTSWEAYSQFKQSGNNPSALAACANNMANINFELHNYDEARSMFLVTYGESKKVDDFYFMIYALHGLGKVSMQQNEIAEAKDFFEKALQLAQENPALLGISNSLTELANFYFRENNLTESERLNNEHWRCAKKIILRQVLSPIALSLARYI